MKRSFGMSSINTLRHARRASGYLGCSLLVGALASTSLLLGCGSEHEQTTEVIVPVTTGNMQLALVGVAPSGVSYRLRDGLFTLTNLNTGAKTNVSTEGDPDAWELVVNLPAGDYQVYLNPGYRVEQLGNTPPASLDAGVPAAAPTPSAATVSTAAAVSNATAQKRSTKLDPANLGRRSHKPKARALLAPRAADADAGVVLPPGTGGTPGPVVGSADGGMEAEPSVELLSPNPVFVTVFANNFSVVNFTFRVHGVPFVTGNGSLAIGVNFVDDKQASACGAADDAYEPNNDLPSAALIATDVTTVGFACVDDNDAFRFPAPVPSGQPFSIQLSFDGDASDIDMDVGLADGTYIGGSDGISSTETFTTISNGGDYVVFIYNLGPSSGSYSLSFDVNPSVNQSNCCSPSGLPGCSDDPVKQCVCAMDDFCCLHGWDELCISEALTECGASCGGSQSCCEAGDTPGCNDPVVNSCVCSIDAKCCYQSFDEICVQEATAECAAQCQATPTSNCCKVAAEPGCLDSSVAACVCGIDPSCCSNGFDQNCVNLATGTCGASCGGYAQ